MKNLYQYLTEWKQDMMPQCVVVVGGPGAGKTYWMNHSSKKFFQNNIVNLFQYRKRFKKYNN